jgi:hypothetical protein
MKQMIDSLELRHIICEYLALFALHSLSCAKLNLVGTSSEVVN